MASLDARKPLLQDYDTHCDESPAKDVSVVSLRGLENGEDYSDLCELESSRTLIGRILMAVRRRNVKLSEEKEFDRRYSIDGKRQFVENKWKVRRCGTKTVLLGLPLLIICFL